MGKVLKTFQAEYLSFLKMQRNTSLPIIAIESAARIYVAAGGTNG